MKLITAEEMNEVTNLAQGEDCFIIETMMAIESELLEKGRMFTEVPYRYVTDKTKKILESLGYTVNQDVSDRRAYFVVSWEDPKKKKKEQRTVTRKDIQ